MKVYNLDNGTLNTNTLSIMKLGKLPLIWTGLICIVLIFLLLPLDAGGMLPWGINGGGAPAILSFSTRGIAFLLIWLIEAIILKKFLDISWGKAIFASLILNAFSAISGIMVALAAFAGTYITIIVLGAYVLLTIRIFVVQDKLPQGFASILILTVCIGTVFVYYTASIIPSQWPVTIYFLMAIPLLIGFGISIMFETLIGGKVLGVPHSWKGILAANIYSFLMLALLVPFYSDNIYEGKEDYLEPVLVQKISAGAESSEIVGILSDFAAPNFYLLGFSGDNTPRGEYWAGMEIDILNEAYSDEIHTWPDPAYGLAIVELVRSYPALYDSIQEEFEWLYDYFGYWNSVQSAWEDDNQVEYISATIAWTAWYQTTDIPSYIEDLPEPSTVIENLDGAGKSGGTGSK